VAETARKRKRRPSSSKRTFVIDSDLRRLISNEAKELRMSEEEYLRLVVHLSETLRTSIIPAGLFDGGMLKTLLTNPMMLDMMKGMIGNVISKWGSSDSSSGNNSSNAQAQQQFPTPQQMQAPGPWGGPPSMRPQWGGQGLGMSQPGMYAMPGYGMQPPHPQWGGPMQQQQPQQQQQQDSSSGGSPFSLDNLSKMMQQLIGRN
jgi:hypothetical protein